MMPVRAPVMNYTGKMARASFVLAFVKRDEITRFLLERQSCRAIARFYDRNPDTIARAIALLSRFEHQVAVGDIETVGREVWSNRLGWERSDSFLEAKRCIERNEIMPKETCGPKRKVRRRNPALHPNSAAAAIVSPPKSNAAAAAAPGPAEEDVLLAAMNQSPLLQRVRLVTKEQQPSVTSPHHS